MPDQPLKEWKYVECFKSLTNGSCNTCKSRYWNTGNKIYAMKKPDGKWLACTDKKCYQEQGGKLTLFDGRILTEKEIETKHTCNHCTHAQGSDDMLHIGNTHYHRSCYNVIAFQATFLENWK